jgi:hypothetical protein
MEHTAVDSPLAGPAGHSVPASLPVNGSPVSGTEVVDEIISYDPGRPRRGVTVSVRYRVRVGGSHFRIHSMM